MPEKETIERAQEDAREGKSPSTQAGEFVREEMHHIREGKHGAAATKQAERDYRKGQSNPRQKPSAKRSRATSAALKKEGHSAASRSALSRQARTSAKKRSASARHDSAMKASQTRKRAS